MRKIVIAANPGVVARTRIALLPGAHAEPEDFQREGFAEAVHSRRLAIDLEFVAPELQHVLDRAILESLTRDVVAPARASGCRSLWLGGISLGGFIALAYAERRPEDLDGLCLLAPYLGNRIVTGEIARAGGVSRWNPERIEDDDEERRIWRFIRNRGSRRPRMYLGLARHDRFGHGHALFANVLPADAIDVVEGGHDWHAWRQLWALFLERCFVTDSDPEPDALRVG